MFQNILDEREEPGAVVHQTLELVGPMFALEFKAQFNNSNTFDFGPSSFNRENDPIHDYNCFILIFARLIGWGLLFSAFRKLNFRNDLRKTHISKSKLISFRLDKLPNIIINVHSARSSTKNLH